MKVHNQGNTIPPDALQVIFNPLVQVAKSESAPHERPTTSLGLGLCIAREIVAAHGAGIAVSSTNEAGTTFAVRLRPRHAAANSPRSARSCRSDRWCGTDRDRVAWQVGSRLATSLSPCEDG